MMNKYLRQLEKGWVFWIGLLVFVTLALAGRWWVLHFFDIEDESRRLWLDALALFAYGAVFLYTFVIRERIRQARKDALIQTIIDQLDEGLVVCDARRSDTPIIRVNPAFAKITGYDRDDVIGRNPRFLNGPRSDPEVATKLAAAIASRRPVRATQLNYRKDGAPFWNDIRIVPVLDEQGEPLYFAGLIRDVTEETMLKEELRHLATALEQTEEAVCIFDSQGRIEYANEAFARNERLEHERCRGQLIWPWLEADRLVYRQIRRCLKQGNSWSGRHRRGRADGTVYEAMSSITPLKNKAGEITSWVAVHRDITEMADMEQQLAHAQKMEAIGTLVGGIAHDFNNVLAGIVGNLYLARHQVADRPEVAERLKLIERQGYDAAGMIRQLLSFARSSEPEKAVIDLRIFLKEACKFVAVSVPENIELRQKITTDKVLVDIDASQLQQSMLNLVHNARHAIEEKGVSGGVIEIGLEILDGQRQRELLQQMECCAEDPSQRWCCLSVRDNGVGMDAVTRQRVFEPFFTTRSKGEGTGLGLAMVKSSIEAQHGRIEFDTEPGEGTEFRIYLPLSREHPETLTESGEFVLPGSGELILIADDDPVVRRTLRDILQHAGYRVLETSTGEEALRLFREHADELFMVILDVVMPKRGGVQVVQEIRRSHAHLPIILMTGYDKDEALAMLNAETVQEVIPKPWGISQLNRILRDQRGRQQLN